ncbi:MAG: HEAT repeat domain-containing protein [Gemmatimonadota bacterium]
MSAGPDLTLRLAIFTVLTLSGFTLAFMGYAFLLHLRAKRLERRREALEARWRGRLLDAGTGDASSPGGPAVTAQREVPEEDQTLFLDLVTEYARALEGPERKNLEELARPYLAALDPLLDDPDPYRRAYALDILGELGYEDARDRIAHGLEDDSGLVAMVAARALARHGDPSFVPVILAGLDGFGNWSANYLASLLTSFGPEAAPALRDLAFDTRAPDRLRSVALQALKELNDVESVEPAMRLLPEELHLEIQGDLIRLIGHLGRPEHLVVVRPFVTAAAPHVRAAALRAVSNVTDRRTSDVEMVSRGLDDPSPWVALQAARGIMTLGRRDELVALANSASPRADLAAEVLEAHR